MISFYRFKATYVIIHCLYFILLLLFFYCDVFSRNKLVESCVLWHLDLERWYTDSKQKNSDNLEIRHQQYKISTNYTIYEDTKKLVKVFSASENTLTSFFRQVPIPSENIWNLFSASEISKKALN